MSDSEQSAQQDVVEATSEYIVDEATDAVMRVHLEDFEGPLEVLLYLIKSQEIDIFDIPIAKITEQYLSFVDLLREEKLDMVGDFLVMAATLIQIKSKMILPVELDDEDEEIDEEDPRLELVEKLIAYRKYKEISSRLSEMEAERSNWFMRNAKPDLGDAPEDDEEEYLEVSLYDLMKAFKGVIRFLGEDTPHDIQLEGASVDEKVESILDRLETHKSVNWDELFAECQSRIEQVCCFLAILELCRMGSIAAHQHKTFGGIRLFIKAEQQVA